MITLFIIYITNADMKLVSKIYSMFNKYHERKNKNNTSKI